MTKINTKTNERPLIDRVNEQTDTAKKIRFLKSEGMDTKGIYKFLKEHNITTKNGTEIRYQHVRNTLITPLVGK